MKDSPKTKRINMRIPTELYNMFAKKCIDESITMTEGFVRYLKYLEKTKWKWHEETKNKEKQDD